MTPGTTGPLILTVGVEDHGRHGTVPDGDPDVITAAEPAIRASEEPASAA
jgi:hypothetical protein